MYKVFIDNRPKEFDLDSEEALLKEFSDYKFIEAAGGIVEGPDGFLFIERHGLWDIPKGKLEKGEGPREGAVREVEEECGIVGPEIKEHLCDTWHTYEMKGKQVLKKTYWYWMTGGDDKALVPQTEEGISQVRYFKSDELEEVRSRTYLSIIEVIDSLLQKK